MNAKLSVAALILSISYAVVDAYPADSVEASPPVARIERSNCLKETGTRLKKLDGGCVAAPGQVITHEDILNSGSATMAEAIDKLSVSTQVHGR